MTMTDPIADMLTRIRNAHRRGLPQVDVPSSRLKLELARVLKEEGFIENHTLLKDNRQGILRIYLRYGPNKLRVIKNLKRVSKPGGRIYARKNSLPRVMGGLGIAVVSTSRGVMTAAQARKAGLGGEVICYVW